MVGKCTIENEREKTGLNLKNWIKCYGDACKGDLIKYFERVKSRKSKNGTKNVWRVVYAYIVRCSYGKAKDRHKFTLKLITVAGAVLKPVLDEAERGNGRLIRYATCVYEHGTYRQPWDDEELRRLVLSKKHINGKLSKRRLSPNFRLRNKKHYQDRKY